VIRPAIPAFLQNEVLHAPRFKQALVAGILLLSIFAGLQASLELAWLVGLGVAVMIGSIVLMRRLDWGIFLLVPLSMSIRFVLGTGTAVPLNLTIMLSGGLIALWILRMLVLEREVRFFPSRTTTPALLFALATTVSLFAGNIRWVILASEGASLAAQLGAWALYVFPMGIFLLVGNRIHDVSQLRQLTCLFLGWASSYIVVRLFELNFIRDAVFVSVRSLGSVFWIFLVAMAAGQCLYNHDLKLRWRIAMGVLVLATLFVNIRQSFGWFSGWMPPLGALLTVMWFKSPRWRYVLITMIFIGGLINFSTLYAWVQEQFQQHTVFSRQATYPIMFELIKANPILGLGPANYYHYTPLYPILGWYVKFNSHSNYVDIIAQTGLLGLGIFIWLVVEIVRVAFRLLSVVQDGFSRAYIHGALGGLAAMLVSGFLGDWFLPFVYNVGFSGFRASVFAWIFLGGLLVIERVHASQKAAQPVEESSKG